MNDITETVTAAFEAEEHAESAPVETPAAEPQEAAPVAEEAKPEAVEQQKAETPTEAPAEEPKAEEAPQVERPVAPRQLKGEYVKSHWESVDKETQDELIRLSSENERTFARAAEAEHNLKTLRKTLEPVQGYISEIAQMDKIPESDVIRNCVHIVQSLSDNPTLTARQMIAARLIQFDDPVSVINEIAKTYRLDLKGDLREANIPDQMRSDAARARYDARQAKYVKPEDTAESDAIIADYVENTPGIRALLDNPDVKDKFIRQIQLERASDNTASDIAIINRAAELFNYAIAPQAIPTEEPKQPTLAEQKMAKVVSPVASNPVSQAPVKREPLTPEQSVRETLRSMGLDD
jgi:hypothetical protein